MGLRYAPVRQAMGVRLTFVYYSTMAEGMEWGRSCQYVFCCKQLILKVSATVAVVIALTLRRISGCTYYEKGQSENIRGQACMYMVYSKVREIEHRFV